MFQIMLCSCFTLNAGNGRGYTAIWEVEISEAIYQDY